VEGTSGAVRRIDLRGSMRAGGPNAATASVVIARRAELLQRKNRTIHPVGIRNPFQSCMFSGSDKGCLGQAGWGKSTLADTGEVVAMPRKAAQPLSCKSPAGDAPQGEVATHR
jgi:hypothetical protein